MNYLEDGKKRKSDLLSRWQHIKGEEMDWQILGFKKDGGEESLEWFILSLAELLTVYHSG